MGRRSQLPQHIEHYVEEVIAQEGDHQRNLRRETEKLPNAGMRIGADQAAFLQLLVRSIGAKRAIEIGTYTGYSALAVALALPKDGKLIACDISDEWTSIGRKHWRAAGVESIIDLRLAPALQTLDALLREGQQASFDFAFIDADKIAYNDYYERCLLLLRTGGLIVLDNMLWGGDVAKESIDPETLELQKLNKKVRDDARVEGVLLTIGDGIVVARKK
jgi:predicted O-methyltransferase YrrM